MKCLHNLLFLVCRLQQTSVIQEDTVFIKPNYGIRQWHGLEIGLELAGVSNRELDSNGLVIMGHIEVSKHELVSNE